MPATSCPSHGDDTAHIHPRRQKITTSDGIDLCVEEYGGSAEAQCTVVVLHGLCLGQSSWTPQVRLLLRRYGNRVRIITYDHRGHGQSDAASPHTYTIAQLACDLAEVLQAMSVSGKVVLAGHSMGGMALLAYLGFPACDRPIEPAGVVLVATAAGRVAQRGLGRLLASPLFAVLAESINHVPTHHGAEQALRALVEPMCRAATRICGCPQLERDTLAAMASEALRRSSIRTTFRYLVSIKKLDLYRGLRTISAPTIVLSGTDMLTPVAHARELSAEIPRAVHHHIPGAGHMLLHEAPHAVLTAISHIIDTAADQPGVPSPATLPPARHLHLAGAQ